MVRISAVKSVGASECGGGLLVRERVVKQRTTRQHQYRILHQLCRLAASHTQHASKPNRMDQTRPSSKRRHSSADCTATKSQSNTRAAATPSSSSARKSRKPSASATPASASARNRGHQQQEDASGSGPSGAGPSSRTGTTSVQGHGTEAAPVPSAGPGSTARAQEAEPEAQHQEHQEEAGEEQGDEEEQAEGSTGNGEPPPVLTSEDLLRNAVDRLTPMLGEDGSRRNFAEHALRTVLDSNKELEKDEERWVEEAQVWVACNSEMEAEIEQLREAMAVSLADAQARKESEAKDTPDPDELLTKHSNTQLMKQVSCVVCPHLLVACLVKEEKDTYKVLSRLLDQEAKCCKHWYPAPGTRYFFQRLAEEIAGGLLTQAKVALTSPGAAGSSAAGAEQSSTPLLRCDGSAGCSKCGDATQGVQSQNLAHLWQQLGKALRDKDQQVAQGLAELPPKLGDTGFIPSIFRIPEDAPPDAGAQVFGEGDTKDCCIELD